MTRLPDWRQRLEVFIRAARAVPFAYGTMDCALFSAGAVQAMTGVDLARGHRGYRTLAEGLRGIRGSHVDMAASLFPEIPPMSAGPGDIAVVPGDPGLALGIVQGVHVYVMGVSGLGLVPKESAVRAFRV